MTRESALNPLFQIDPLCERFEDALSHLQGEHPLIEDYLHGWEEKHGRCFSGICSNSKLIIAAVRAKRS